MSVAPQSPSCGGSESRAHGIHLQAWRKAAIDEGLLLERPRAHLLPAAGCGVSAGYLVKLAKLATAMLPADSSLTVAAFVSQIVLPLTRARKGR